jgi:hypothetical protein
MRSVHSRKPILDKKYALSIMDIDWAIYSMSYRGEEVTVEMKDCISIY